jgi:exopolysaccharide biosynthesis polyprenyl glycosylphosphotransferase
MKIGRKTMVSLLVLDTLAVGLIFNVVRLLYDLHGLILLPLVAPAGLVIVSLYLIDGYKPQTDMLNLEYASQHAIALLSAMLATLLVTFVVIPGGYSLQQSRVVVGISFLALLPVTLTYRRFSSTLQFRKRRNRCIIFLGDRASALAFKEECVVAGMTQPVIHASPVSEPPGAGQPPTGTIPVTQVLAQIASGQLAVEAMVLRESNSDLTPEISQQLVDLYFTGVPTYTLELFHQIYWRKIPLYRLNQTWLFQEGFRGAREPVFERIKRIVDILLSSIGLVLATPVFLVVSVAIWLEDRGPVFFKQTRIGKNRVPFSVYKFRSMRQNVTGVPYAQKIDTRITKVGRFLRASRFDELPQILNVIRGEMSLIGPRAEWNRLVADYEKQIPCYHFRHLVRPGITGWAQVNYPYGASIEDTLRKLEYDLYYIRHFSFGLDASIVLKTIHVMLFGKGR